MRIINLLCAGLLILPTGASPSIAKDSPPKDLWDRVEHHDVDSDGVRIHYVALGKGPLVVMIHGFPDFWYTWRRQMEALDGRYRVVAVDQRGYDLSGRPRRCRAIRHAIIGQRYRRRNQSRE